MNLDNKRSYFTRIQTNYLGRHSVAAKNERQLTQLSQSWGKQNKMFKFFQKQQQKMAVISYVAKLPRASNQAFADLRGHVTRAQPLKQTLNNIQASSGNLRHWTERCLIQVFSRGPVGRSCTFYTASSWLLPLLCIRVIMHQQQEFF